MEGEPELKKSSYPYLSFMDGDQYLVDVLKSLIQEGQAEGLVYPDLDLRPAMD